MHAACTETRIGPFQSIKLINPGRFVPTRAIPTVQYRTSFPLVQSKRSSVVLMAKNSAEKPAMSQAANAIPHDEVREILLIQSSKIAPQLRAKIPRPTLDAHRKSHTSHTSHTSYTTHIAIGKHVAEFLAFRLSVSPRKVSRFCQSLKAFAGDFWYRSTTS
jgi:hypothetical protein